MLLDFHQKMTLWKYKIEKGKGWSSSAERKQFFKYVKQGRSLKENATFEIKGPKNHHHTVLDPKS
jgi:hypothetical protein